MKRILPDESATGDLGRDLAAALTADASVPGQGAVIYLHGSLGAGKTSLARALLRALGETGPVRSPTYTLMEPYEVAGLTVWHMDLYRLGDPEELEFLGIRELDTASAVMLVEWPENGAGLLPSADLSIRLTHLQQGREAVVEASGSRGEALMKGLSVSG
ncbi:tRNA (adenosine(37)-N6)-threonylcarbamoyltransferase complex ATPase subunit type 1 TsaE [Natronospira bacteriovora]|uniref:tRNA threonylcarbamoyladenosine biosynthesis protein TsaE n=1 Tax=Natronospira bacteriovora TaxID=3069753 RepID=A0ABU0W5T8_9GAMM|nr:tRNA (adenosine(37)-N6)-threonylcarbamoyltransferase complex ATPase subunit type 1 TsaE [Natronospira sp. AB-CW4]MDQ2069395.1 tRNA (adenosine(37)-N6)-threonylcarbamoyltransferase complex ATPase subunit type 1 TsaE [Natronospira sp. AB-CW4]